MKLFLTILIIQFSVLSFAQNLEQLGIRIKKTKFKNDTIEYVVQSKPKEEHIKKPLLFLAQGSLPQPLLIKDNEDIYPIYLPFNYDAFLDKFHLVIVSKPGIPALLNKNQIDNNYCFTNIESLKKFENNNFLNFYTDRNVSLFKELKKEAWVDKNNFYIISHSEGSYIAINMASKIKQTKKIVYSGGNPMGRIMSLIAQNKFFNSSEETFKKIYSNWEFSSEKDNTRSFSEENFLTKILNLKIPILVTYGSKDWNSIFNDYLHIEAIRKKKYNITFSEYHNHDHNFFILNNDNLKLNNQPEWQTIGDEWFYWLVK